MVKGNWERRAELVAARRVEERNKKAQKSVGSKLLATAESVITKVQRDPLLEEDTAEAWLQSEQEVPVCREWFRTESCSVKRCKQSHEWTIGHLRNVNFNEDENTRTENLPLGPFLLSSVARKDYSRLMFLSVAGECVYDKTQPDVWEAWIEQRTQFVKGLDRASKLRAISEASDELGRDRGDSMASMSDVAAGMGKLGITNTSVSSGPDFSAFFCDADNQVIAPFSTVFSHLVPYLSTLEVRNVAITSKAMYSHCQRVDVYKMRRREALTQIAADLSRVKKTEKKKKAKQANVKKESKKDGFARGGNS